MAKRQNFIVGSTNAVTENLTNAQLDAAFDRYEILTADKLDGVFNAVSDYSNDSSNEIANAIQSITGSQPTGATQDELASALQQMRSEIETTSLTFKGYVSSTEPSASDYDFKVGDIWIQSATMPTVFPAAIAGIWDGVQWATTTDTYTQKDFDFFRNVNDNGGYYWFGGEWTPMTTDMDATYFELNQSGKWAIKSNVNLPGAPTTTTANALDKSTKIATTEFVHESKTSYVTNCITAIPQDIKLELNGGILTVKAGSKAYIPNGGTQTIPAGTIWTPWVYMPIVRNYEWIGVAYNGTKFVSLTPYGDISTSIDGTNWTAVTRITNLGSGNAWQCICWGGTKFVALGKYGHVSTSPDGTNWGVAAQNTNLGNRTWQSMAWNGTKFVALSQSGYVSTSTDGTNWAVAVQNANLGNRYWDCVAWDGTKFVAITRYGYVSTSTDGTTWDVAVQNANLASMYGWASMVWDGTKFVAISSDSGLATSVDGINWSTPVTINNIQNACRILVLAGNQFFAFGRYGSVSVSPQIVDQPTFDEVIIDEDTNVNVGTGSYTKYIFIKSDKTIAIRQIPAGYSGFLTPFKEYPNMAWYDTANNVIKSTNDGAATWVTGYSLPIGIVTTKSDVPVSIDRVFNGFGYIGSTVFALPGVKGLCPNGRNSDGTLNNVEKTLTNVTIKDLSERGAHDILYLNANNQMSAWKANDFNVDVYPTPASNQYYLTYSTGENCFYKSDNGAGYTKVSDWCFCGEAECIYKGRITEFSSKTTFNAGDYTDIGNFASTDLDNLTLKGKNISTWSSYVTNCLTEVPQNIKLELSSGGTLTLKAGSKIYKPNGREVFDVLKIETDITFSNTGGTGQYLIGFDGTTMFSAVYPSISVASTNPSPSTSYKLVYNANENKVYFDIGSWIGPMSLPLALVSSTNGKITGIDKLFNGYSYIGTHLFVYPGVKGLIPAGRNPDGSSKNIEVATKPWVQIQTIGFSNTGGLNIFGLKPDGSIDRFTSIKYRDEENKNYLVTSYNSVPGGVVDMCPFVECIYVNNALSSLRANYVARSAGWPFSDVLVEYRPPVADNNYTWFRKYKSGWVEQGGIVSLSVAANTSTYWSATFPWGMKDTNYVRLVSHECGWTLDTRVSFEASTNVNVKGYAMSTNAQTIKISWYVAGQARYFQSE